MAATSSVQTDDADLADRTDRMGPAEPAAAPAAEPEAEPEAEPDATAFFDEGTRAGMRRAMAQRFRRAGLRAASTSWRRAGAAAISATRLTRCCCPRRITSSFTFWLDLNGYLFGMGLFCSKKNTPRWRFMRQRLMIEDMLEQLMHCEWWTRRCSRKGEKGKKGISELIDMEVLPLIMKSVRSSCY